jgi:hypothetical protein
MLRFLSLCAALFVVSTASASAAQLRAPSNANVGERIMAIVKVKKAGNYTLTLAAQNTRNKVCGRDLGAAQQAARGAWVRFEVTIPRRLPCFKGSTGSGPRVGSVKVRTGQYRLFFGQHQRRFFWTSKATTATAEIGLS